ncbi:MAG: hypothetical protein O2807_03610 [bacterium]|nr:hypothetical protein [bacterium]
MIAHKWQCDIPQLRHLTQFNESWCPPGQENLWLETLSEAAREALHRFVARDFDCTAAEMQALYERLQVLTQLQYFDKVRKTGEDSPEAGQRPPSHAS